MPLDDFDDPKVQRNWGTLIGEHPSDDGDPIAALRSHFAENIERLNWQISQAEKELRSLQAQHHGFFAGLRALNESEPKAEATVTPEH
jgi:hypothetical protein